MLDAVLGCHCECAVRGGGGCDMDLALHVNWDEAYRLYHGTQGYECSASGFMSQMLANAPKVRFKKRLQMQGEWIQGCF
jgi:hypothetical protein